MLSEYPYILSQIMNTYYQPKGFNPSRHSKRAMSKGFFLRNLMSLRENSDANSLLIPACGALENYINKTKLELSSLPIKQYQDNLTRQEEQY